MKHKNKIKKLEARRAEYDEMVAKMNPERVKGFKRPGSLKG